LPLHSNVPVCIPKKEDFDGLVDRLVDVWRLCLREDLTSSIRYCVKHAISKLSSSIFSTNCLRFGYEYGQIINGQNMIYHQSDAIWSLIGGNLKSLDMKLVKNQIFSSFVVTNKVALIQNMIVVINEYVSHNITFMGDPSICPYLIQTNQMTGITPTNIENAITRLTYYNYQKNDTV